MNIIITGGSRGIGKEIVKQLSKNNNVLVISREKIENTENLESISIDLSSIEEIDKLKEKITEFNCDVLINNAGSGKVEDLEKLESHDIEKEFILNLLAPMKLTSFVAMTMKKNNYGRIINISSISGENGTPYLFAYSASKAGLINFTQSAAEYFRDYDITVNTICPGGINTEMAINGRQQISKFMNQELHQHEKDMLRAMGKNQLIEPCEVAKLVQFLINMPSINGQCVNICGLIQK